jgi:hypothetical protein
MMIDVEEMIAVAEWAGENEDNLADLTSCQINAPPGMTLGRAFFVLRHMLEYVWYEGHLSDLNGKTFPDIDPVPESQYSDVFHQIKLATQLLEGIPSWLFDGPRQDGNDFGNKGDK